MQILFFKYRLSAMQKKNKQIEEEKKNAEYQCSEFEKTFSTFEEELKLKYEIARYQMGFDIIVMNSTLITCLKNVV